MTLISVTRIILKPTIPDAPAPRIPAELTRDPRGTLKCAANACGQRKPLGRGPGACGGAGRGRGHRTRATLPRHQARAPGPRPGARAGVPPRVRLLFSLL